MRRFSRNSLIDPKEEARLEDHQELPARLCPNKKSRLVKGGFAVYIPNGQDYSVTVKLVVLVAVPPFVVIVIFPVFAAVGTVAVTSVSESAVKSVAATPSKLTRVVCVRLTPVIVSSVPTAPLVGVKLVICGVTRKAALLWSVPA